MTALNLGSAVDRSLGFIIPSRHARGRVVRLAATIDAIAAAHAYPPTIERLLTEALALTALLGSTLKDSAGQMTLQAQTEDGVVSLLVCDFQDGKLRGYVKFDAERLDELGDSPGLEALFGKGYLAITFDQATSGERYQGIVPLEGDSLGRAAESYFAQSEQIPSLIRIATADDGTGLVAGGILIQHLPEGEEGRERLHTRLDHPEWEHVAIMGGSIRDSELLARDLELDTIVWRLFNEEDEVRTLPGVELARGCRCDRDYVRDVLSRFPESEKVEMADERGLVSVDCAFCSHVFEFSPGDLAPVTGR
ncbi:Molecular chaperone Hsp33 [Sphingomonas antarctica]|uniref:Hsp33 family molecular chaperone HslO n=1 Tax=Sphingomonas antarctica TaxID=2040274 RepID=UPI0039E83B77